MKDTEVKSEEEEGGREAEEELMVFLRVYSKNNIRGKGWRFNISIFSNSLKKVSLKDSFKN